MNYTSSQSYHTLTHWQSNKKKKELTDFIPWGEYSGDYTIPWMASGNITIPWGEYSGDYTIPWGKYSGDYTIPWGKWEEQTS